jgi:glycosyltransferase involved in cell wall biosynthesis
MTQSLQETAIRFRLVRFALGSFFLARGTFFRLLGNEYRFLNDYCWTARVADVWPLSGVARRAVMAAVRRFQDGPNTLVACYRRNAASDACASLYSITGRGTHDLFRDLIVLKRSTPEEKGVILLKYARTFDAVVALFDLERLMQRYIFVLEPCWAGYWDPSLLMFIARGQPVFVQCFTADDLALVEAIGEPLVALRMGPADWVDADLFTKPAGTTRTHDLVMVANWAPGKRHAELFRALAKVDRPVRVLLIGFPWFGRTQADIRREAAAVGNDRMSLEIVERLPAAEVSQRVGACKVFVFLSRKEGDSKALVEAMFADVPAIVYDRTVGGAPSRINAATGVLSSDEDLPATIVRMLEHHHEFAPRAWALEHTGSAFTTRSLSEQVCRVITAQGGRFTGPLVEKTNSPNLAYKDPASRAAFQADYDLIVSMRRADPRG